MVGSEYCEPNGVGQSDGESTEHPEAIGTPEWGDGGRVGDDDEYGISGFSCSAIDKLTPSAPQRPSGRHYANYHRNRKADASGVSTNREDAYRRFLTEDPYPEHAKVCDDLYHLIYIEGKDPNCEEAVNLRRPFPELFVRLVPSSKDEETQRSRMHYVRKNPSLRTIDYAEAWGVCYETASNYLNRMERAGKAKKVRSTPPDRSTRWEAITK